MELIHIIHESRQEWCKLYGLGPYTFQQATCLHIATCGHISETQAIELEDAARFEDALLSQHATAFDEGGESVSHTCYDLVLPCSAPVYKRTHSHTSRHAALGSSEPSRGSIDSHPMRQ